MSMNTAIFYDTETSGLPLFKEPSEHPGQPHIVQLAAILVDLDTRKTIASIDVIVRPHGWDIPQDMVAIHGITTEMALDLGVSESIAVGMFMELWNSRLRIAHNEIFDARILRIALMRYEDHATADNWKASTAQCSCQLARPYTKLEKNKAPTLNEAYRHFYSNDFANAHTAMADTQACRDVWFAIQDKGNQA